jgi:hypothetical protein
MLVIKLFGRNDERFAIRKHHLISELKLIFKGLYWKMIDENFFLFDIIHDKATREMINSLKVS